MATVDRPDAILADLWMPTFEPSLLVRLREAAPTSLVFIVSGLATDDAARAVAGIEGIAGVCSKRDPPQTVAAMVRETLARPRRDYG